MLRDYHVDNNAWNFLALIVFFSLSESPSENFFLSFDLTSLWVAKIYQSLSELHKHFFRLFKFFDNALVCFFDKNEAHQNTFSLSSLFYYFKYNRDHFECEISPGETPIWNRRGCSPEILNSTSSSVRVTTELHQKHAHAYLVIAVLLSGQSTRLLLHGTKILAFTTIISS